jgi:hypothetical protein
MHFCSYCNEYTDIEDITENQDYKVKCLKCKREVKTFLLPCVKCGYDTQFYEGRSYGLTCLVCDNVREPLTNEEKIELLQQQVNNLTLRLEKVEKGDLRT